MSDIGKQLETNLELVKALKKEIDSLYVRSETQSLSESMFEGLEKKLEKLEGLKKTLEEAGDLSEKQKKSYEQIVETLEKAQQKLKDVSSSAIDTGNSKKKYDKVIKNLQNQTKNLKLLDPEKESKSWMAWFSDRSWWEIAAGSAAGIFGTGFAAKMIGKILPGGGLMSKAFEMLGGTEAGKWIQDKIGGVFGDVIGMFKKGGGMILDSLKVLGAGAGTIFKGIVTGITALLQIPFGFADKMIQMMYDVMKFHLEIQRVTESVKDNVTFFSKEGIAMMEATKRMPFVDTPGGIFGAMFGYGHEGRRAAQKALAEANVALDDLSAVFTEHLSAVATTIKGESVSFYQMYKAGLDRFGMDTKDLKLFALEAVASGEQLPQVFTKFQMAAEDAAKKFGQDTKKMGKAFAELRSDWIQFGHLSDEQMMNMIGRQKQLMISTKDLSSVFSKISTFEDAAEVSAMLSQTFGMALDTMDLIQAKDPTEIVEQFRSSMYATGRTFDDLNRHEKSLLQNYTNLSDEAMKTVFSYENMHKSYEEIQDTQKKADPTQVMAQNMTELSKTLNKILTIGQEFKSVFDPILKAIQMLFIKNPVIKRTMSELHKGLNDLYKDVGKNISGDEIKNLASIGIGFVKQITKVLGSRSFINGVINAIGSFADLMKNLTKGEDFMSATSRFIDKVSTGFAIDPVRDLGKIRADFNALVDDVANAGKVLPKGSIEDYNKLLKDTKAAAKNIVSGLDNTARKSYIQEMLRFDQGADPAKLGEQFDSIRQRAKAELDKLIATDKPDLVKKILGNMNDIMAEAQPNFLKTLAKMGSNIVGPVVKMIIGGIPKILNTLSDFFSGGEVGATVKGGLENVKDIAGSVLDDILGKKGERDKALKAFTTAVSRFSDTLINSGVIQELASSLGTLFIDSFSDILVKTNIMTEKDVADFKRRNSNIYRLHDQDVNKLKDLEKKRDKIIKSVPDGSTYSDEQDAQMDKLESQMRALEKAIEKRRDQSPSIIKQEDVPNVTYGDVPETDSTAAAVSPIAPATTNMAQQLGRLKQEESKLEISAKPFEQPIQVTLSMDSRVVAIETVKHLTELMIDKRYGGMYTLNPDSVNLRATGTTASDLVTQPDAPPT